MLLDCSFKTPPLRPMQQGLVEQGKHERLLERGCTAVCGTCSADTHSSAPERARDACRPLRRKLLAVIGRTLSVLHTDPTARPLTVQGGPGRMGPRAGAWLS